MLKAAPVALQTVPLLAASMVGMTFAWRGYRLFELDLAGACRGDAVRLIGRR